jgi:hypothetical protein
MDDFGRQTVKPTRARHARATRAMHNFSRKFTKSRARALCGLYAPLPCLSMQQYVVLNVVLLTNVQFGICRDERSELYSSILNLVPLGGMRAQ